MFSLPGDSTAGKPGKVRRMSDHLILGARTRRVNAPALVMALLSIAAILPVMGPRLMAMALEWPQPGIGPHLANSDFINYWMAGRLAVAGDVSLLFDPYAYYARLQEMFGADYNPHNWSYPPHAILLSWPLGFLAYKPAMAAFLGLTLAFFLVAAEIFRRRFAPLADPALYWTAQIVFVAVNIVTTQNGFLTGGLLLLVLSTYDRRPWLAGLCLGVLTIKPQLGLLVPVMLLFSRQWATIAWAGFFTILFVALSGIAFGVESWKAYVEVVVPYQHGVMTGWEGAMLVMMPTVSSGLRQIGIDSQTALAFQTAFNVLCLPVALFALWKARAGGLAMVAAFVFGSFLAAPYSFNYDTGAMVVACAALAALPGAPGDSRRLFAAFLCLLPATVMFFGILGLPIAPLLILAGLILWIRTGAAGNGGTAGKSLS